MDQNDIIKRKNNRYAFEWYVDEQDKSYFRIATSKIKALKKLTIKLVGAGLIVNIVVTLLLICLLYKYQ